MAKDTEMNLFFSLFKRITHLTIFSTTSLKMICNHLDSGKKVFNIYKNAFHCGLVCFVLKSGHSIFFQYRGGLLCRIWNAVLKHRKWNNKAYEMDG